MEYIRKENCECRSLVDIDALPYNKRALEEFWMRGFIYKGAYSRECSCHREWRLTERYNCLAKPFHLPEAEELDKIEYLGEGDACEKLFAFPEIVDRNNLKDIIIYCYGPYGNQKTTSVLRLMLKLIREGKWVSYTNYTAITKELLDLDFNSKEYRDADYLIIDDCFSGEVINFQTTFNELFDIILKRRKPTILISDKKLEDVKFNHYDMSLLNGIKDRVELYNSHIEFNDHVANILLKKQGPIDLWSM